MLLFSNPSLILLIILWIIIIIIMLPSIVVQSITSFPIKFKILLAMVVLLIFPVRADVNKSFKFNSSKVLLVYFWASLIKLPISKVSCWDFKISSVEASFSSDAK